MSHGEAGRSFIDAEGRLVEVVVHAADGALLGRWKPGHRDVSAWRLQDKDRVRAAVQRAIGEHVMAGGK